MRALDRESPSRLDSRAWRPSTWFKLRAKLAPAFPTPVIGEVQLTLPASVAPPTPTVDLEFPRVRIRALPAQQLITRCSDDLLGFSEVSTAEAEAETRLLQPEVSDDMFQPLQRPKADGRAYRGRENLLPDKQGVLPFDQAVDRDRDGFRKSFRETRSPSGTTRRVMTIWELILPLLEPPVSLDFGRFFDLPNELYPFQVDGVRFLVERDSALLGDDMGTGKTVQAIVAMRLLFQKGVVGSALIVVPLTILKNWDRELMKWSPCLNAVTVVRGPKEQREIQWEKPAHIWVATYGTIRSDIDHILKHRRFDLVVLDEIQAIKNLQSQQTQSAKKLPRQRAWGLSGTPIENRLEDVCSIFGMLKPGLLRADTVTPDGVKAAIRPYFLRRRKKDVLQQLPDKKAFDYWLALDERQRAVYDRAEGEGRVYLQELGDTITVHHILQLLQRLKMLCNRDPESGNSAKLDFLADMLPDAIEEGSKVLVFSQYLDEGVHLVEKRFAEYEPVILTGRCSPGARENAVHRFQTVNTCKLLVATQKTGGIGLHLVAGNYVFHFDHWWNPATGAQAEDRVHRIGQTKDVFVYHLWTEATIEERIHGILERKRRLYSDVIDSLSNVESTGLSQAELFELFDLKPPPRTRKEASETADDEGAIRDTLFRLTDQQFEVFVKRLYDALGYGTRLTPQSRDAGVDVIASRSAFGGTEKLAIQVKRYDPQRKVGRPVAQSLLGVVSSDPSYTKGVLVTTASFSSDCRSFASGRGDLELIDGARLARMARELNLSAI